MIRGFGLRLTAQQYTVQLDPFHAAEGVAFVAGTLDQHGHAEPFELLLDLGRVVDHGGFDRKVALLRIEAFIVRGAVFAGVQDIAALHGLPCLGDIPAIRSRAGQADAVQTVHRTEQIHSGGGNQIDAVERLPQDDRAVIQPVRDILPGGDDQIPAAIRNVDTGVPVFVIADGKLIRMGER